MSSPGGGGGASTAVRVLLLEDNPDDAELALIELRRAGLDPVWRRVETEPSFRATLDEPADLILADNNLPGFDALAALEIVNERGLDVPFIIVSGSIGEDTAVRAMQSGAADYVIKDRLARLGHAARRALEQYEDRRMRRQAQADVQRLERLRAAVDMVRDLAATLEAQDVVSRVVRRLVQEASADVAVILELQDGAFLVRETLPPDHRVEPSLSHLPVLEQAMTTGRPAWTPEVSGDHGDPWSEMALLVAIPLHAPDLAMVILLGRREGPELSEGDLEALGLIANVAAVAARNARLYEAAEAAGKAKSEFLNMAAHELRTPLSVITGYLSLLTDGTLGQPGPGWRQTIELLHEKAGDLSKLVESLLLASRMDAGSVETRAKEIDLGALVRDCVRRADARARLLQAVVDVDTPEEPVLVVADPEQVGTIVDNLLDNALTYAMGSPWVKVAVNQHGQVSVEDRGPGIPADSHDLIFERFQRLNNRELTAKPGTGLGLYISRELALRQGGRLDLAASRPGVGSRFLLELPVLPGGHVS